MQGVKKTCTSISGDTNTALRAIKIFTGNQSKM